MFERDIIDLSPLRKQLENYYLIERDDGCYTAISPISVIDSKVWYSVAYNRSELCSKDLTIKKYKKYLKIKGFPECRGIPIVDDKKIITGKKSALVPVRSKDKRKWDMNEYYTVEVLNQPKKGATEHEKRTLLRNLIVRCSCVHSHMLHIISPLGSKLLPSGRVPYTDSVVDLHGGVALLHLILTRGFDNSAPFGFDPDSTRITQYIVRRQLGIGKKTDNYSTNSLILRNAKSLFRQLEKRLYLKK